MIPSDEDLLRQYVHENSNPAFAELVRRHLNLVYSAARRQVRSASMAEDIAQSVFFDLSKNAAKLKPSQPIIAWLHLVTRRTAIDAIRQESRRQLREQTASEIAAMKSPPSPWAQVEPLLDEALEKLNETDRHAILERYFSSKSLREVGETLGISEDAAQKRISRALDQLRTTFARRGVAVTAASLATDLSAHVIVSAPIGLGASISSGALSTALLAQTANTLSMTALNKTLIATVLVLIASLAYETNLLGTGRSRLLEVEQMIVSQKLRAQQLAEERDRANASLEQKRQILESEKHRAYDTAATESDLDAWLGRVARLKARLAEMPEKNIPEMRYLTSNDWLTVTLNNNLETDDKIRKALGELRRLAKDKPEIGPNLQSALIAYAKEHTGRPADDTGQLRPYLHPILDDEILKRYKFVSPNTGVVMRAMEFYETNEIPGTTGEDRRWLQENGVVDEDYDVLMKISDRGWSVGFEYVSKFGDRVDDATQAFIKANGGEQPASASQLRPYFIPPVDDIRLTQFWDARRP